MAQMPITVIRQAKVERQKPTKAAIERANLSDSSQSGAGLPVLRRERRPVAVTVTVTVTV